MAYKKQLGEILVEAGIISRFQLAMALEKQKSWGGKLGSTLVRMGFVREGEILRCLSSQLRYSALDLRNTEIPGEVLDSVPADIVANYRVVPVEVDQNSVTLAMVDPGNLDVVRSIEFRLGVRVKPIVATESSIDRAIEVHYGIPRLPPAAEAGCEAVAAPRGAAPRGLPSEVFDPGSLSSLSEVGISTLLRLLIQILVDKGAIGWADLADLVREVQEEASCAP